MKKRKGWKEAVVWISLSLACAVLAVSIIWGSISANRCEDMCQVKGAMTFQVVKNGEFNFNDACVCYYQDSVKTFALN